MAETGKPDSTLQALLYRNANDSSVEKRKPDYIAKINSNGKFTFTNLSEGIYRVYALKDGDGGKTYNSKIESFAFIDKDIVVAALPDSLTLFAYEEEKDKKKTASTIAKSTADKKLKFTPVPAKNMVQDLRSDFELTFNNTLKNFDTTKIILTDTNNNKIEGISISLDSTRKIVRIKNKWPVDTYYHLVVGKDAVSDSANNQLPKSDTFKFKSKAETDYGSLTLRFTKIDLAKHPVIQFLNASVIVRSVPITGTAWSDKLFVPGEYELRILYDENNNGIWDPGNYSKKLQPEKAITLDKKLTIRADWDNERDIEL
jgi:methionine-rich copper-binding protein CopC/uncharacterized protein (DUF2141 family)